MAPPKPGPPSAGGSKFSNKGQSTGTTGARLWEKKPSSFKGPSKHGGAPGGPRSFKSGPSEGGKYVLNTSNVRLSKRTARSASIAQNSGMIFLEFHVLTPALLASSAGPTNPTSRRESRILMRN